MTLIIFNLATFFENAYFFEDVYIKFVKNISKLFCALGSIQLNGSKIGCLGTQKIHSDGKALGKAVLDCGLGSIEVDTL